MDDQPKTDEDLIREAMRRLAIAEEAESENRTQAIEDLKFGNGDQWANDIKRDRETSARPCLTINLTDAMVRRVINACRETRPRIKIHAVSDGADKQTAEVIDGLIRHIEYSSSADVAYDTAVESAVRGGWGYIRVSADYIDANSFDQDLKIERVRNPFTVYTDPASITPDGSDYDWVIVSEMMKRSEYRERFGDDPVSWDIVSNGDNVSNWTNKEEIRVAEYWRVERERETLYRLSDGTTLYKSDLPSKEDLAIMGLMVIDKRETVVRKVRWYLMTATKILDRRDWPGKFIPVIPVYGREMDLNGKVSRKGMIRDLRDPARMYNYARTSETEIYALQPKAPWLIAKGQINGFEADWRDANRKPTVTLPYNPTLDPNGNPVPPPMRQNPPPVAAGFSEWSQSSQSDFLAVAGMPNDPGQDMKGEVVSGIAIQKRQGLSDISHFDFYDNLTRSLRHIGRILIDLIPHYYDTPRIARIIREDGTPESVQINEPQMDPVTQAIVKVKNDLTVGKYEVVVDTGPAYQTKREESAEAQLQLLSTPLGELVAQNAGDLVVRSMDFPNSDKIADRIQASIPAAQVDAASDLPPKAQTLIAGLQAQLKQANQKNLALELELHTKHTLKKMEEEGKDRREQGWLHLEKYKTDVNARVKLEDTHTRATTSHDVAEINVAGQLLNTHAEASHNREAAQELLKHADEAIER